MKIITLKQRLRDKRNRLKMLGEFRKKPPCRCKSECDCKAKTKNKKKKSKCIKKLDYKLLNEYIDEEIKNGLCYSLIKNRKKGIIIHLPERMDLEKNKRETIQHINAISRLVQYIKMNGGRPLPRGCYNLGSVNFDSLKYLSTPAALMLTAELSNWEDTIKNKLSPKIKQWNTEIYSQLHDLGFFNLFQNKYSKPPACKDTCSDTRLVSYIKGFCGDEGKIRELREGIRLLVGDKIDKWTFLASGLDEAITNVFHHAYPEDYETRTKNQTWYLTGSYNETTKELKVVFYDQGIGIPNSLPSSKWRENIYELMSSLPALERRNDEERLKAAVEYGRTRTGDDDRGKGLGDLLVFIKKRENGALSILSGKGQYTFTVNNKKELTKTSRSKYPIEGTLIIWRVTL